VGAIDLFWVVRPNLGVSAGCRFLVGGRGSKMGSKYREHSVANTLGFNDAVGCEVGD
jgi:hypothetical protein